MNNIDHFIAFGGPAWVPVVGLGFFVVLMWSFFWKGLGLWHAARRADPYWFVAILVLNSAGILEIIYLFAVLKIKFKNLFSK